jgi:FAD:protein FMN transferase
LGGDALPVEKLHRHFVLNLESTYDIYLLSHGAFDPTVGPLVEAWGFGSAGHQDSGLDSNRIRALLERVGMQYLAVRNTGDTLHVEGIRQGMRLDFSALAKGYGVDKVYDLLHDRGVNDMFIEIGGEVRTGGQSPRGDPWIVGINVPREEAAVRDITARFRLTGESMATSGNYRNSYILDGRKVWHTINPRTGYPEENTLLSATVIHPSCMIADGVATACMVSGVDGAKTILRQLPGAGGFLIYLDSLGTTQTWMSAHLGQKFIQQ